MSGRLLAPLGIPAYRSLWLASVVSNFGTMIQSVGVAWLMTSLTGSPVLVAMVPFAALSPVLLFGMIGGALADMFDRRGWMLKTQTGMLLAAAALAALTASGHAAPASLLVLIFLLGVGNALNVPAWQSAIQDLVPLELVPSAVSLNAMSFNLARTLGPVIGGILVGWIGVAGVMWINAMSFLAVIVALLSWKPVQRLLPGRQRVLAAVIEGVRYLAGARHLLGPYALVVLFCLCGSSAMALLPLVARESLGLNAPEYGMLLGAFGLGALAGGASVPTMRRLASPRLVVQAGGVVAGISLALLAVSGQLTTAAMALVLCGASWVSTMINLNVAVQTTVISEMRGRAMACYFTLFQGSFAIGALLSGWAARFFGLRGALFLASLLAIAWLPMALRLGKGLGNHTGPGVPPETPLGSA
ncbi:MAG: hypothetical protein Fur0032_17210 [Terrimicrobiaceae bacterium]